MNAFQHDAMRCVLLVWAGWTLYLMTTVSDWWRIAVLLALAVALVVAARLIPDWLWPLRSIKETDANA